MEHTRNDEQPENKQERHQDRCQCHADALKEGLPGCGPHLRRHEILHAVLEDGIPEIQARQPDHSNDQTVKQRVGQTSGHPHLPEKDRWREQNVLYGPEKTAQKTGIFPVLPGCFDSSLSGRWCVSPRYQAGAAILAEWLAFGRFFPTVWTEHASSLKQNTPMLVDKAKKNSNAYQDRGNTGEKYYTI
jgi:hypothetical protein